MGSEVELEFRSEGGPCVRNEEKDENYGEQMVADPVKGIRQKRFRIEDEKLNHEPG